jgi:death-on-curing protein
LVTSKWLTNGLLNAAAHRPQITVLHQDAYSELHTKAAALLHSIVRNHVLVDGNRRLSWLAAYVFYDRNGYELDASEEPAYGLVVAAGGGELGLEAIAGALEAWAKPR